MDRVELPAPELSVIIVNWNARDFLAACLDSVLAEARALPLEIWVVDNASSDGSAALVRERYPDVKLIANEDNAGFAAANNQGLARARGRYAILLNPDTVVKPGALARMVQFLAEHPRVGVVGPKLVLPRGQIQGGAAGYEPSLWTVFNYSFFFYNVAPPLFRGLWLARRQYVQGDAIPVDWVSGAALMVRMEAVHLAGPLDEHYFMYAEDVDWCRRLREAGWQVFCLPDVSVVHYIGRSIRQRGRAFFAVNVYSLDRYYRSRYRPAAVRLLHLFGVGGFTLRLVAYETLYLVRRRVVYAELRDKWAACLQASIKLLFGAAPAGAVSATGNGDASLSPAARAAHFTEERPR